LKKASVGIIFVPVFPGGNEDSHLLSHEALGVLVTGEMLGSFLVTIQLVLGIADNIATLGVTDKSGNLSVFPFFVLPTVITADETCGTLRALKGLLVGVLRPVEVVL
jgi:Ca2+/Na+ antiporter